MLIRKNYQSVGLFANKVNINDQCKTINNVHQYIPQILKAPPEGVQVLDDESLGRRFILQGRWKHTEIKRTACVRGITVLKHLSVVYPIVITFISRKWTVKVFDIATRLSLSAFLLPACGLSVDCQQVPQWSQHLVRWQVLYAWYEGPFLAIFYKPVGYKIFCFQST